MQIYDMLYNSLYKNVISALKA